jgi:hypothetical protein
MVGQSGWRFRLIVFAFLAPSLVPLVLFLVIPIVA